MSMVAVDSQLREVHPDREEWQGVAGRHRGVGASCDRMHTPLFPSTGPGLATWFPSLVARRGDSIWGSRALARCGTKSFSTSQVKQSSHSQQLRFRARGGAPRAPATMRAHIAHDEGAARSTRAAPLSCWPHLQEVGAPLVHCCSHSGRIKCGRRRCWRNGVHRRVLGSKARHSTLEDAEEDHCAAELKGPDAYLVDSVHVF